MSQALIQALQNPELFDHPVDSFQLIETHISWVILTGPYAYKIKKPHDFGFLDFSTLAKRKHFCEEELRLNQRLAADMYLAVLPITGSEQEPQLDGGSPAIEYAIKMVQFPQDQLADQLLQNNKLGADDMTAIAANVAAFHQEIAIAGASSEFGNPGLVMAPVLQNFEQIRPFLSETADTRQLNYIEAWARDSFTILEPTLSRRKAEGYIRECHGDLHLGNITRFNGNITLFDCIEFNESFRWTDVMNEIAFLAMDLEHRELHGFANRFINDYLEKTGDYAGLKVLNFYKSYRAMVRAKVALLGLHQENLSDEEKAAIYRVYRSYADLAERYTQVPNRFIILMHGYSGTGKSTVSTELVDAMGVIRLKSDIERKRLFGVLSGNKDTAAALDKGIYSQEASDQTFTHLTLMAEQLLTAGYAVLIDATFLKKSYRDLFHQLAEAQAVPLTIVSCSVDDKTARAWIEQRAAEGNDPSDADVKIYEAQLKSAEPLDEYEQQHTIEIDAADPQAVTSLLERFRI